MHWCVWSEGAGAAAPDADADADADAGAVARVSSFSSFINRFDASALDLMCVDDVSPCGMCVCEGVGGGGGGGSAMKTDPWLHTLGKVLHVANGHLHAAGRADNLAREVFLELLEHVQREAGAAESVHCGCEESCTHTHTNNTHTHLCEQASSEYRSLMINSRLQSMHGNRV